MENTYITLITSIIKYKTNFPLSKLNKFVVIDVFLFLTNIRVYQVLIQSTIV